MPKIETTTGWVAYFVIVCGPLTAPNSYFTNKQKKVKFVRITQRDDLK